MKIVVFLNHKLTDIQIIELKSRFCIDTFITLPQNLLALYGDISPYLETLSDYLSPLKEFLLSNLEKYFYQ